ncbi:MAG: hypothetical protein AAFO70_02735, partial [Pseudomonadota bacterium]
MNSSNRWAFFDPRAPIGRIHWWARMAILLPVYQVLQYTPGFSTYAFGGGNVWVRGELLSPFWANLVIEFEPLLFSVGLFLGPLLLALVAALYLVASAQRACDAGNSPWFGVFTCSAYIIALYDGWERLCAVLFVWMIFELGIRRASNGSVDAS